ncbi:MAG TPA: hypothetical protein VGM91_05675 [Conexibacter sp.]|jgi:mannose-6-phosphate isomerase-like protein (cupin superfamily)
MTSIETAGRELAPGFTRIALDDVTDAAPGLGLADSGIEIRFAQRELGAEETGVTFHRLAPGVRQPFGHRHNLAEEVYVVVSGSGRMKLDDEIVELAPLVAIRVAPPVTRSFEAGPDGLELVVAGARHDGDGELVHGFWSE